MTLQGADMQLVRMRMFFGTWVGCSERIQVWVHHGADVTGRSSNARLAGEFQNVR